MTTMSALTSVVKDNQEVMRRLLLEPRDKDKGDKGTTGNSSSGADKGKRSRKFPQDRADALEFVREALQHGNFHRDYPPMGVGLTQEKLYKAILQASNDPEFGMDFIMTPFVAHSLANLQFGAIPKLRRDGTEFQLEKGARLGDFRTKAMAHRYRELEFTIDSELKDIEKRLGPYVLPANKFELMECFGNWAKVIAQICGPMLCYLMMLGLHRMMHKHLHDERKYTLLEMLDFIDVYMASWSRRVEECATDPVRYKYTDEEHNMSEKYGFMRIPLMLAGPDDPVMYNNLTLPIQLEREDAINETVARRRKARGQHLGANYRFLTTKKPPRGQWSGSQDGTQDEEHDLLDHFRLRGCV